MPKITKAPDGFRGLYIHGANDQTGNEREPHCHLGYNGKNIIVSFKDNDIKVIVGKEFLDSNKETEIIDWVHSNLTSFFEIWNTYSSK